MSIIAIGLLALCVGLGEALAAEGDTCNGYLFVDPIAGISEFWCGGACPEAFPLCTSDTFGSDAGCYCEKVDHSSGMTYIGTSKCSAHATVLPGSIHLGCTPFDCVVPDDCTPHPDGPMKSRCKCD